VTTHLENLEKSGNSKVVREKSGKMEKVREKSGEVKFAEIWLFVRLKFQYHRTVVSYIHAQIICTELSTTRLLYFVSSWCHLVCHFTAVTTQLFNN